MVAWMATDTLNISPACSLSPLESSFHYFFFVSILITCPLISYMFQTALFNSTSILHLLSPSVFITFYLHLLLSLSVSICVSFSSPTGLSTICEHQTLCPASVCGGVGSLEDKEIKLSASI